MTRFVLAAVDLTQEENDLKVLGKARQLADLENAFLAVVTVLPDFQMSMVSTYFADEHTSEILEEARKELHLYIERAVGRDNETKHVIRMGSIYDEVLKTAEDLDAQLIVVGAHKPNTKDFLMGPNAARIARHAKCSVYVVR